MTGHLCLTEPPVTGYTGSVRFVLDVGCSVTVQEPATDWKDHGNAAGLRPRDLPLYQPPVVAGFPYRI